MPVAGRQDDPLDAHGAQFAEHRRRAGTHFIRKDQHAGQSSVDAHRNDQGAGRTICGSVDASLLAILLRETEGPRRQRCGRRHGPDALAGSFHDIGGTASCNPLFRASSTIVCAITCFDA